MLYGYQNCKFHFCGYSFCVLIYNVGITWNDRSVISNFSTYLEIVSRGLIPTGTISLKLI